MTGASGTEPPVGAFWPGIDDKPPARAELFKVCLTDPGDMAGVSRALRRLDRECRNLRLWPGMKQTAETPTMGSYLVAFSEFFFRDCPGLSHLRPGCLKLPNLRGDDLFPAVASKENLHKLTPHLLLKIEYTTPDIADRLRQGIKSIPGLKLEAEHGGARLKEDRNSLGYHDGTSNLGEVAMPRCPMSAPYEGQVFVPSRGDDVTGGGTYLVLRRYKLNLERWKSLSLSLVTPDGHVHIGDAARDRIIGRRASDGAFLDEATGAALADETEFVARGPRFSHARKANPRGKGRTTFGKTIHPRDIRILRRVFEDRRKPDGSELIFMAFQDDIQNNGFEFIHNHWLMARGFMQMADPLLDPERGFVEPLDAGYYFVPRYQNWFGEVFFETVAVGDCLA